MMTIRRDLISFAPLRTLHVFEHGSGILVHEVVRNHSSVVVRSVADGIQHGEALALAAASTRIRHMEETLGAALLMRGRQGVTPTQAGRTLLQHARAILRRAERLREDLGTYAGGLAGQVRVLSNPNAQAFLPEALSSF